MKVVLKTVPPELELNYNETFNSEANIEIRRKLVPELVKALKPSHHVSHDQINNWLNTLFRSKRSRNNYKIQEKFNKDDRHLHANGHFLDGRYR